MMMEAEKKTLDYSVDFPELPDASTVTSSSASSNNVWSASQPAIKSSVITEAFKLSADERASRGFGKASFGTASEEQQKCNQIAQLTGTKIELNEAKDQSITILITGKQKNVEDARTKLVQGLQTQATVKLDIPKEFHSYIIGKQGAKLKQLENKFFCRIHMPGREEKSDTIRIVGPNEYIVEAARHIKSIGDEMAKQKTETLKIPRAFYPWIRGVNNEKIEDLMRRTGAKVNIPPMHANNELIIVTGEREGVEAAVSEIQAIYDEKKDSVVSVEVNVCKAQHRYIIGPKRTGLDEIFRETEVLVELPPEESDSETVVLRGPKDKLGDAVGAVYQKASSSVAIELPYKEWMRRHLIGPKGQNLANLVPNQDKLKIDFEEDVIYIEGLVDQVKQAQEQLNAEIARLENEFCCENMKVAPSLHRHIIGRSGAFVNKLKEDHDVQISIPNESSHSNDIRLEGRKENVEAVKAAISEIVTKQEKKLQEEEEKRKKQAAETQKKAGGKNTTSGSEGKTEALPAEDPAMNIQMEIDPKHHRHFIVRGAEVLKEIQRQFNCQISFPKQETGESTVTIRGRKSGVPKAKARLEEIVEDLDAQTQLQMDIDPKHHRHFIVRGAEVLKKIQNQFDVQISFPKQETGESSVTVKGRKENVQKAKERIEEIVEDLDAQTQIHMDVDSKHHRHFIVRGAEVLRKIQNQFDVQISFPKQETGESSVTVKGRKENVQKAKERIEEIVEDLDAQTQIQMNVDPKYHRHFIVRGAEVLKEIQRQCNCQISFPKQETGESAVSIKGREDNVQKAKERIEQIVADLYDQFDESQYIVRREEPPPPKPEPKNIEMVNAPWQLDSLEQFPGLSGGVGSQKPVSASAAWGTGQRR